MKNNGLLLGAHMSIAGGIYKALQRGASIDCTAIQIFTHSNRSWSLKQLTEEDKKNFASAKKETHISSVIVHASYLINLASKTIDTVKKSIEMLEQELIRCDFLGIKYLVLHPGSGNKNEKEALNQVIKGINKIFDKKNSEAILLLENMAGQGSSITYKFEQLAYLKSGINNNKRIGFCFDTCHAWAAGYDFSNKTKYKNMWEEFDKILDINNLKAIHMNDSKKGCGSKIDRHANIGKGTIGLDAFKLFMNDERFSNVPKILETPDKDLKGYEKNLVILKKLLDK